MHLHRQNRMLPQPQNRMPPQSSNLASMTSPTVLTGAQAAGPTHLRITTCPLWLLYIAFELGPRSHHGGVPSFAWSQNNEGTCASKVRIQIVS